MKKTKKTNTKSTSSIKIQKKRGRKPKSNKMIMPECTEFETILSDDSFLYDNIFIDSYNYSEYDDE